MSPPLILQYRFMGNSVFLLYIWQILDFLFQLYIFLQRLVDAHHLVPVMYQKPVLHQMTAQLLVDR